MRGQLVRQRAWARFLERTAERRFRCVDLGVRMGGGALGLVRISLDGQAGTRGAAERRFSAAKRREAARSGTALEVSTQHIKEPHDIRPKSVGSGHVQLRCSRRMAGTQLKATTLSSIRWRTTSKTGQQSEDAIV